MMETTTRRRPSGRQDLDEILRDRESDHPTRLLRLQGWRGADLAEAVAAGNAHRLAPGFCALGATLVALTGSSVLAGLLMATAINGIFARNHPVEWVYNSFARRTGRQPIPRNRAAKRLGCAIGAAFLAVSTIAIATGATLTGQVVAGVFAAVAWFVATTNLCVPSVIFVALFGAERSTSCRLI